MSDWESIFGAGVSAESVVDGINASLEWERRDNEAQENEQRRASLTAYHGDDSVKASFLLSLFHHRAAGRLAADDGGLLCLSRESDVFDELETITRVPAALSLIINTVFQGMRRERTSSSPTPERDTAALDWLIRCFDSIEVGVDLRFIAPKFAAHVAGKAMALPVSRGQYTSKHIESCWQGCRPALNVVNARARGVLVPNELARAAMNAAARTEFNRDWVEGFEEADYWGEWSPTDFMAAILASAASPSIDSATRAAQWAVQGEVESRLFGDGDEGFAWTIYGEDLLVLIREAPTQRLNMIRIDEMLSALCLKLVEDPELHPKPTSDVPF